jgi:hypothetical protein
LLELASLPTNAQQTLIEERFDQWKGSFRQTDDVLVVGIRL